MRSPPRNVFHADLGQIIASGILPLPGQNVKYGPGESGRPMERSYK
jgi:hypothetical protein